MLLLIPFRLGLTRKHLCLLINSASRRILLGAFTKFKADDFIMLFTVVSCLPRNPKRVYGSELSQTASG